MDTGESFDTSWPLSSLAADAVSPDVISQQATTDAKGAADALAGRICAAAAMAARSECQLLDLIGEFDATNALRWWTDIASVAQWLCWSCSMTPAVAREHVRVAKALRQMPTVRAAFGEGRLSYSKVREVTRVVDRVDEGRLCELALTATAAQLAKMISAFRASPGGRLEQEEKRQLSWRTGEDGMVTFRGVLPAEEAAILIAAVGSAKDQFGAPPAELGAAAEESAPSQVEIAPRYSSADALLDVARGFLATAPEDRSGEDRTLVVVHVSADALTGDVPAGTSPADTVEVDEEADLDDVPAGTPVGAICHIDGAGAVESETARRLACDADVLGAVIDRYGDVLALGRTQRFVSRAQRRALMIRDRMCRFPGCAQDRHLKAHHVVPWSLGGPTDLHNLILLCQFHHTAVHEGGMTIQRRPGAVADWRFLMPDGTEHKPWYTAEALPRLLQSQLRRRAAEDGARLRAVAGFQDADARTIRPRWAGEPFDLHACVRALLQIRLPDAEDAAA